MSQYATVTNMEQEIEGWETEDADALNRYLQRASRDVDRMVGYWRRDTVSGLKFGDLSTGSTFAKLATPQRAAVIRATCAQALYRINLDAAREGGSSGSTVSGYPAGARSVSGPDFAVTFATAQEVASSAASASDRPYWISDQAWGELAGHGLVRTTAIMV